MAASGSANDRDARATLYAQGAMEAERKAREEKTARLRKARLAHEAVNSPAPEQKPAVPETPKRVAKPGSRKAGED